MNPPVIHEFGRPIGDGLAVWFASTRPGLLFTDVEKPELRIRVAGAPARLEVRCRIEEAEGPWHAASTVTVATRDGAGETALPLKLPGRGLFHLHLQASVGGTAAEARTTLAVLFTPRAPDPASPWGLFHTPPTWLRPSPPDGVRAVALQHRLLGAAWSRVNFWNQSFGKVTTGMRDGRATATCDPVETRGFIAALREQGITILGEIAQCPTALSSRPGAKATERDCGELQNRVKPRSYDEWDAMIEGLAREFAADIRHWEIWNEVNYVGQYWMDSEPELVELVDHTAAALRRGNPATMVLGCGFVNGYHDGLDRLLGLGVAKHLDAISIHYTDIHGGLSEIEKSRSLMRQRGIDLPLWNSEETSEVPLENLAHGIERSFQFMHVAVGDYPDSHCLVNKDLTPRPFAVFFSVGSRCLGTARPVSHHDLAPGWKGYVFSNQDGEVAAFRGVAGAAPARVRLELDIAEGGEALLTDRWGRSTRLAAASGQVELDLDPEALAIRGGHRLDPVWGKLPDLFYITGARRVRM